MTQIELIDRLCAVNTLLTDIVNNGATWNRSDTDAGRSHRQA